MRSLALAVAAVSAVSGISTTRDGATQHVLAAADATNPRLGVAAASASTSRSRPLGVGNGCVADERLTASSVLRHAGADFGPARARLQLAAEPVRDAGWRPAQGDVAPFIEVDLGTEYTITSVVTQGGSLRDYVSGTRVAMWVTKYKLQTSVDGRTWDDYGGEFNGNNDADTPVKRDLFLISMENARARFMRVLPTACAWQPSNETTARTGDVKSSAHSCALRLEFYGQSPCKASGCTSATPLGVAAATAGTPNAGTIPASAFSASSFAGTRAAPSSARLMGQASVFRSGGWSPECPTVNGAQQCDHTKVPATAPLPFLQIDLGRELEINAVATQGSATSPAWVTEYSLDFSNDGHHWARVSKSFVGNADNVQAVKNSLARPVLARYVRITPTAWQAPASGHYALRVELYGPDGYVPGESSCRVQLGQPCGCGGSGDRAMPVIPEQAPGSRPAGCGCDNAAGNGVTLSSFVTGGGALRGGPPAPAAVATEPAGRKPAAGGAVVVPVIVPAGGARK